jgi:hypothetical protein
MAAGPTYTPIATSTLSSTSAGVTFSTISGSYTDLRLVISAVVTPGTTITGHVQLNGDTASNYSRLNMRGNGSATGTNLNASISVGLPIQTSSGSTSGPCVYTLDLFDYANSTTYKTSLAQTASPEVNVEVSVGSWRNTAAVTSIYAYSSIDSFGIGSTFTLYGITAA